MPLYEVPSNHVRRNGTVRPHYGSSQNSKLRPRTPNGENNALEKPSSIQNMLRSTAEVGDEGQFSIKPPRIPSSIPRPSAGLSITSQISPSQRSLPGTHYAGHSLHSGRRTPSSSHQGPPSSSGSATPKRSHEHFRRPHQPYRAPSVEDYHSYSMTQSSYTTHSLTNRHPYTNGHNQARGGFRPGIPKPRPRSPYAYPTRLKRPGHRPSSPALSDLSRSMVQQSPGAHRNPSMRTASPSSAYNMSRAPSPWQPAINRSDSVHRFCPPIQPIAPNRVQSPSISSSRPTTLKPSSSLRSAASSSRLRLMANDDWAREQSLPDSVLFYDYTEAFGEQNLHHSVSTSTGILADIDPPGAETDTNSTQDDSPQTASPAELTSDNSLEEDAMVKHDISKNQNAFKFNRDVPQWTQATRQDLSDVLELPERELQSDQATQDRSEAEYSHYDESISDAEQPVVSSRTSATAEQQLNPSQREPVHTVPSESDGNDNGLRRSRMSISGSSFRTRSASSARSSPGPESQKSTPEREYGPPAKIAPQLKLEIPRVGSDNGEKAAEMSSAHPVDSLRAPSFEGHSGPEFTDILSPTPERSIGSPASRNRFSKILSIDEGHAELDTAVNTHRKEQSKDVACHIPRPSSIVHLNGERLWRRRSSFFRDKPKQPTVTKKPIAEVSDSEEEPELTSGLRATFCKPDGQIPHYEVPTPTPLMSKLPRRAVGKNLNVKGSPVPRNSIPNFLQGIDVNVPQGGNIGVDLPLSVPAHSSFAPETKPSSPVDKELPPVPKKKPAIVSLSPSTQPRAPGLPFAFTPLARRGSKDESTAEPDAVSLSHLRQEEQLHTEKEIRLSEIVTEPLPDRKSAVSPPDSRPWNLDTSYPWNNQVPELEVNVADDTEDPVPKLPRFKLRVHRASSSTGKLTKTRNSSDSSSGPFASSHDILQSPAFRRKRDPNLSIFPGQVNSSHAVMRSSPQHTRFVESFEAHSPVITLMPPSPGPGHEVRSFFSDDSSQMRPKGSLRKRFSDFKAKIPRSTSSDDNRGYDRGLLSSALGRSRASGRSSRQSEHTAGASSHASRMRHLKWKMMDRLKMWWHHGEDKFRDWGWKMRYRRGRYRAASTPLYAGV